MHQTCILFSVQQGGDTWLQKDFQSCRVHKKTALRSDLCKLTQKKSMPAMKKYWCQHFILPASFATWNSATCSWTGAPHQQTERADWMLNGQTSISNTTQVGTGVICICCSRCTWKWNDVLSDSTLLYCLYCAEYWNSASSFLFIHWEVVLIFVPQMFLVYDYCPPILS